jgi:hypothetical protein
VLTENEVISAVAKHLSVQGYRIEQTLNTDERGVDIVAKHRKSGKRLLVEAKGGTSSKAATARYGKPFTRNQARSHVSVALYCAVRLRDLYARESAFVALAFPDDPNHRSLIESITPTLGELGIIVFFVDATRRVTQLRA